jgi:hypothetical protein
LELVSWVRWPRFCDTKTEKLGDLKGGGDSMLFKLGEVIGGGEDHGEIKQNDEQKHGSVGEAADDGLGDLPACLDNCWGLLS